MGYGREKLVGMRVRWKNRGYRELNRALLRVMGRRGGRERERERKEVG